MSPMRPTAREPMSEPPVGYASRGYALTCAHLGAPRTLRRSGVTLFVRDIAGRGDPVDACASYPLLATDRWNALALDLAEQKDIVSFVGVVDPLAVPPAATL